METALGEALKSMRPKSKKEKQTIRVCDECETPMIWTFFFPGWERYCLNCGYGGGMLGTGHDVEATRELLFKKRLVDAIWNELYGRKGMCPGGSQRTGCKKCNNEGDGQYHIWHLSKAEKEWHEIGKKYLEKVKGIFNDYSPIIKSNR